ncbi:MAG: precorrin-2 C(20)-methyltransferase [Nitrospinae bacterium]|nr:precorrin-2 C(20)-methyltransferase [Nitrospinota bacterium]
MTYGTLYGIGVGPGDPELVTVKGARLLGECKKLFVPKARIKAESVALAIIERYVNPQAVIEELVFPMVMDKNELERQWAESASKIASWLATGQDACFVTLGDSLLYSTYIYLVRALKKAAPEARVSTVPGVTAFSAAAALTDFPVGEAKEPVTIIPAADDLGSVRQAVRGEGTVILMKVGKRLHGILDALEEAEVIDSAVFTAYAGLEGERVETNLRNLKNEDPQIGYLSTILVHCGKRKEA